MPLLRTSLLMSEPTGTVKSLDELFALAHAMEVEAANRYTELAEDMRRQNKTALADVFTKLAVAEREHVDSVTRWSQSRRGKSPDSALVRWQAAEILDAETADEIRTSRLITPYRALAMAVRNEERAFAFWSYVAAFAQDGEIKSAAEAMAREELEHVATLRRERRRTYHQERDPSLTAGQAATVGDSIDSAGLERRLAIQLGEIEGQLEGPLAVRARDLRQKTIAMSAEAPGFGRFPAAFKAKEPAAIAEALADGYLEGAERSNDPARMLVLQTLAERAISRLAWLRSLTGN